MLDDFLEQMSATPFVDGTADCALTVADWVVTATGCPDPAAHLRGRYSTALGRERLLRRMGGLEVVMADCAARAGLWLADHPVRGDVGVVAHEGQRLAAICLGTRWGVKSSRGLMVVTPSEVISAWSVPHG